jgi:hypothetical protein
MNLKLSSVLYWHYTMAQTVKIINLTIYIYFAVEYKDISTVNPKMDEWLIYRVTFYTCAWSLHGFERF